MTASLPPIRALSRGLALLRLLNQHDGASLGTLTRQSGLARGTVYRLMTTLEALGLVQRRDDAASWSLTARVRTLSHGFDDEAWTGAIAHPHMVALCRELGWPVVLATLRGTAAEIRETTDAETSLTFNAIRGGFQMRATDSATGLILLAHASLAEREALLAAAAHHPDEDPVALASLPRRLDRIRAQGYTLRQLDTSRQTVIAVPVPTARGGAVAALALRVFTRVFRATDAERTYLPSLRRTAAAIGAAHDHWAEGLAE